MVFDPLIKAEVVYVEGDSGLTIPSHYAAPRGDQMQWTVREQLIELAGRTCYESMGRGRSSAEYHSHLFATGHHSVHEHAWFAILLPYDDWGPLAERQVLYTFARLRGADILIEPDGMLARFNLRHFIDIWRDIESGEMRYCVSHLDRREYIRLRGAMWSAVAATMPTLNEICFAPVRGEYVEMKPCSLTHISMFLSCSRGVSHEQVRHRYAVSQRSTRFIDESSSPYVTHPMITKYLDGREVIDEDHSMYDTAVAVLRGALERDGCGKAHANKQARGAARSFLRTSLYTEMIFTASVEEWVHMIKQRMTNAADAEIRILYNRIHQALTSPMLAPEIVKPFNELGKDMVRASDGVGYVIG